MRIVKPVLPALLVLGLCGCGNDDTCGPTSQERIAGRVVGPNGPAVDAIVEIKVVDNDELDWMTLRCHTDEKGEFDIGVPPGRFVLSVYPGSSSGTVWYSSQGAVSSLANADTLRVAPGSGTARADFILAGLDLHLDLPPEIQDRLVTCWLYPSSGGYLTFQRVEVSNKSRIDFTFDFLPPEICKARIDVRESWRDESGSVWLPSALESSMADSVKLQARVTTSWEASVPVPGYITGVVHYDWRRFGTDPAIVSANTAQYSQDIRQRASSEGEFNMPVYGAGRVRLSIYVRGGIRWIGGEDFEGASEFVVGPGLIVNVDPITIGGIFCRLVGDPDWEPYSARVTVHRADHSGGHGSPVLENGTIAYLDDPPGTYLLSVEPLTSSPWRPQWYDRSDTREGGIPVVISDREELIEIDFALELGGRIRGQVFDFSGEPVASVELNLSIQSAGGWYFNDLTETDWDGTFLIEGLPDGGVKIGAQHPGTYHPSQVTWYPGVRDADSAQVITIENASEVDKIQWQLVP